MSSNVARFPVARLSPAFRPSVEEVLAYAELIAAREGAPPQAAGLYQREAELQLWAWHAENDQAVPKRRGASRPALKRSVA